MHLFKRIIELHKHRDIISNKVLLALYVVDFLFIFIDLVYLGLYFKVQPLMAYLSLFWLVVNFNAFFTLEKENTLLFSRIMFLEMYTYFVLAVLLMGWDYGFQQYFFAIVCSFFLPFYLPEGKVRNSTYQRIVGIIFVSTFFILQGIVRHYNLWSVVETNMLIKHLTYSFNSLVSMFGIVLFSVFSSRIALESKRRLSRRADFDELTGIYNRYSLNTIINSHINVKKLETFNVALLDIDFFKKVNDTYGHNVGDEVLKIVAKKLDEIKQDDIDVGRWGGEEFLIVSKNAVSYDQFKKVLETVRKYFEKNSFDINNNKISITVSIGLTMYKSGDDIKSLVKKADNNLYVAKSSGRNKIIG